MAQPYDSLKPHQIAATIRSLPRRVREAVAEIDAAEIPIDEPGPDGRSAVDLIDHMTRSLIVVDRGLEQILLHERPTVMGAVMDLEQREWIHPSDGLRVLYGFLDQIVEKLASRIEQAGAEDWQREGVAAGVGPVTALDVAREAARSGVEPLRRLEALHNS